MVLFGLDHNLSCLDSVSDSHTTHSLQMSLTYTMTTPYKQMATQKRTRILHPNDQ